MKSSVFVIVLLLLASWASAVEAIDEGQAAAAGIRKISGKRLTLYTDVSGWKSTNCRTFSIRPTGNGASISALRRPHEPIARLGA